MLIKFFNLLKMQVHAYYIPLPLGIHHYKLIFSLFI
jgi:hypothetical protein